MIVAAHQPAYLPWLGYFDRIKRCDTFVYLDSVQFENNSFINRNRIKTATEPQWLTIPVLHKDHLDSSMLTTRIENARDWRKKHLRSIEQNYRKAPFFAPNFAKLEQLYRENHDVLADLCWHHLTFWLKELRIETRVLKLSTLPVASRKSDLVFDLCRHLGANQYVSGALGRGYLQLDAFAEAGIAVSFQDYKHPEYPQLYGAFAPYMGIVDAWMNLGEMTADLI